MPFQPPGPARITERVTPYFLVHKTGMHKSQDSGEVREKLQKELHTKMIPTAYGQVPPERQEALWGIWKWALNAFSQSPHTAGRSNRERVLQTPTPLFLEFSKPGPSVHTMVPEFMEPLKVDPRTRAQQPVQAW